MRLSILQIISSAVWGGREQHVKDLTKGLKENGHDVRLITRPYPMMINNYAEVAEVTTLPLKNMADIYSIWSIVALIKKHKVDVIHTHAGRDAWIALLATKIAGRGKVFNTRHTVSRVKMDSIHRWYYENLEKVICVSSLVRNEFLQAAPTVKPEKAVVVYNGVDTKKLIEGSGESIRAKLNGTEVCLIGYAGRISSEKGLEYLIEAGYYLKCKQCKFKIVIAGNGKEDYLQFLREKVEQFNLQDDVVFLGFTNNIAEFMNGIDIFVLPSVWQEAFGLVLCEAMVCKKVVVATNGGAQAELIDSGHDGFLVCPRSSQEIGVILEKLIKNPSNVKDIGENAKEKVLRCFTLEHMVISMEKCYRGEII